MQSQGIGTDRLDRSTTVGDPQPGPELNRPQVGDEKDVGRHVPDDIGREEFRRFQHGALRSEPHADAGCLGRFGQRPVDLERLPRPTGHPGHHERRLEDLAQEFDP